MSKLPVLSGRQAVQAFGSIGYLKDHQRGSFQLLLPGARDVMLHVERSRVEAARKAVEDFFVCGGGLPAGGGGLLDEGPARLEELEALGSRLRWATFLVLGTFLFFLLPVVGLLLSLWLTGLAARYLAAVRGVPEKPSAHAWTSFAAAFAIATALVEAAAHLLWLLHALHRWPFAA